MRMSEEHWLSTVDSFSGAALTGNWLDALSALSSATGARAGELIGLGSANTVPFNWVTELGKDYATDFIAMGGGDPKRNPFVRVGSQASALTVLSSEEFVTRTERRQNAFLAEHSRVYDVPYICLTPLIKEQNMLVGLAVMRSAKQGEITVQERAIFSSIAPHVRAAVRTQMALEQQGASLMAGTLEALSLSVFISDRQGLVRAMTPKAESLLSNGTALKLKNGVLYSAHSQETRALGDALATAARGVNEFGLPVSSTVLIRDQMLQPIILDVLSIPPRDYVFGFDPGALIVVRGAQPKTNSLKHLLAAAYRLTQAEIDVAVRLVDGQSPEQIAEDRQASIGTVRTQIRSIYEKLGVNRFSEFAMLLNRLQ